MKRTYKLVISNNRLYKELELVDATLQDNLNAAQKLVLPRVGNDSYESCLIASRNGSNCFIEMSEDMFLRDNDGNSNSTATLKCGETVEIWNYESNTMLYHCEMVIASILNEDGTGQQFDYGFSVPTGEFSVGGGNGTTIKVDEPLLGNDSIIFMWNDGRLFLKEFQAQYGLFLNGTRVHSKCTIRNYSFIAIDGIQFYFKDGYLFTDSRFGVHLPRGIESFCNPTSTSNLLYPKYNRCTRLQTRTNEEPIEVLTPPSIPDKPSRNIVLTLLPSLAMLILIVIIRGFMSTTSGNYVILSAGMMAIGIISSVISFIGDRRDYKKRSIERIEKYTNYINKKEGEIKAARQDERVALEEQHHNLHRNIVAVTNFNEELFDKKTTDADFLTVNLGKGKNISRRDIIYSKRECLEIEDGLSELPEKLYETYHIIKDTPVTIDMRNNGVLGFVGENPQIYTLMKNITLDIAIRHYYRDSNLFYIINPDFSERTLWLRWLPHVRNDDLGVRNIVDSAESKTELLEYLYTLMVSREEKSQKLPHIIVFVLNDIGIKTHPVSHFFGKSASVGVTFIFFENNENLLPECCDSIIRLHSDNIGEIIQHNNASLTQSFYYETVDDTVANQVALRLAPIYCEEVSLEGSLRKTYTFYEMFNLWSVNDISLEKNWARSNSTKSLAAPIGINSKNEIVVLDIHEKAHGPHGLIAGTTGSGKSELLQTYILSMALCYSPYEVGFVIIDFKGGGLANQFYKDKKKMLPHLMGTITNIDGDEIARSLRFLKAEKNKRERAFEECEVKDIDSYIEKFKSGIIKTPLPHLIIIVDEFAELKSEQPDFMNELVSTARVGRSLGMHLILATQKPAGQVSDQIWSNSRFKLCLKVQSQSDSNEVIKSPLAAEIREPGRAYFQVGNNEIFELLQSGYSGTKVYGSYNQEKEFTIDEVSLWGGKKTVYSNEKSNEEAVATTQFVSVLSYINSYCNAEAYVSIPQFCLEPLEQLIEYPESIFAKEINTAISVPVGIYDDPDNQFQGVAELRVSDKNSVIIGSAQTGKTNIIQTIIRGIAEKYSPNEVNIYILDFGSMFLKNFESLPHVGGVVCAADDDKFRALFKMLNEEVHRRKDIMVNAGVSSLTAYREGGGKGLPHIIIIVDNFTALKETYLTDDDPLLPLCRDGSSIGISFIIANAQTSGFGYRYFSTISNHIAFSCNDGDEISSLFGYSKERPKSNPGHCLIDIDKTIYHAQIFRAFKGDKEKERSTSVQQFIGLLIDRYPDTRARAIPSVPDVLTRELLYDNYVSNKNDGFAIGIDYNNFECVKLLFKTQFMLALIADQSEVKTSFISSLLDDVQSRMFSQDITVYIIDSLGKSLKRYADMPYVSMYSANVDSLSIAVDNLYSLLQAQYDEILNDTSDANQVFPLHLVIVNNRRSLEQLAQNKESMKKFENIYQNLREMGVLFIFADIDNVSVPPNDLYRRIRDEQSALVFGSLKNVRLFTNISSRDKNNRIVLGRSDAFLMRKESIQRIKLVGEEDMV